MSFTYVGLLQLVEPLHCQTPGVVLVGDKEEHCGTHDVPYDVGCCRHGNQSFEPGFRAIGPPVETKKALHHDIHTYIP